MRVLVTGSRGLIGGAVAAALAEAHHAVVGYDLKEGRDILDVPTLEGAIRGCDAVVHSAALLGLPQESPSQIMEVNLQGTWNLLSAAQEAGVRRFVFSERSKRPEFEWDPYWEYGAFIDLRDLSAACLRALTCEVEGYRCVLVTSSDITTSGRTSRELVQLVHPAVEWRGGTEYEADPYRTLVDIEPARDLLGWSPQHTWRRAMERGA